VTEQAATGADPRTEPFSLLASLKERFHNVLALIEELVNINSAPSLPMG
jgi:hypothetical protein